MNTFYATGYVEESPIKTNIFLLNTNFMILKNSDNFSSYLAQFKLYLR